MCAELRFYPGCKFLLRSPASPTMKRWQTLQLWSVTVRGERRGEHLAPVFWYGTKCLHTQTLLLSAGSLSGSICSVLRTSEWSVAVKKLQFSSSRYWIWGGSNGTPPWLSTSTMYSMFFIFYCSMVQRGISLCHSLMSYFTGLGLLTYLSNEASVVIIKGLSIIALT